MSHVRSYRDLEAWQLGMDTAEIAYRLTAGFPQDERYGLTSQMRRAAVSIPSNIAEGHARRSLRVYINHLGIALGSLGELDTELDLAGRLRYCDTTESNELRDLISRTRQTVHGLRRALEVRIGASVGTFLVVFIMTAQALA